MLLEASFQLLSFSVCVFQAEAKTGIFTQGNVLWALSPPKELIYIAAVCVLDRTKAVCKVWVLTSSYFVVFVVQFPCSPNKRLHLTYIIPLTEEVLSLKRLQTDVSEKITKQFCVLICFASNTNLRCSSLWKFLISLLTWSTSAAAFKNMFLAHS